jgi:hypothetical protein
MTPGEIDDEQAKLEAGGPQFLVSAALQLHTTP